MDILYLNDGMMHRMDEIGFRREVQRQLIYMQDGAVIQDMPIVERDV